MPTERARKRAQQDKKAGKSSSTQAGEYVREEMDKMKHGGGRAKSRKQAIAIGLSEARRDGVNMPPPKKGKTSAATRKKAERDSKAGAAKRGASKSSARKHSTSKSTTVRKRTTTRKRTTKSSTTKRARSSSSRASSGRTSSRRASSGRKSTAKGGRSHRG